MNPLVVAVALIVILLFLVAFVLRIAPKHGELCSLVVFGLIAAPLVVYSMQQVGDLELSQVDKSTFVTPVADTVKPSSFEGGEEIQRTDESELIRILESIES